MMHSFSKLFKQLQLVYNKYDEQSHSEKSILLHGLKQQKLPLNQLLPDYANTLLFIIAHPPDSQIFELAHAELLRISGFLKKLKSDHKEKWSNSGLPFTIMRSNFSHDLIKWMLEMKIPIDLYDFKDEGLEFKECLKFVLPDLEKEICSIADSNLEMLNYLNVKRPKYLNFLVTIFNRLESQVLLKDYLFDKLNLQFEIKLKEQSHSKLFNKIPVSSIFYHRSILKKFDHLELLNRVLPESSAVNADLQECIQVVSKLKLMLLQRETEPVSYMDAKSIRYYQLENGISIALFTMIPSRQLPIESYVGYTLFKNGYPAAYGGAWLLGKRALFGINIFEWFRGGESGFILCQLLRTYRQIFSIDYFEIEPYQYGLGNPEGIESGAFWFYYRFGFRPVDKTLNLLAKNENDKIAKNKAYKSSSRVLEKFTQSNLSLNLDRTVPFAMWQLRDSVSNMIHKLYSDNRLLAEQECLNNFVLKSGFNKEIASDQKQVLIDLVLICKAFKLEQKEHYQKLIPLILNKPVDVYKYQKELLSFLGLPGFKTN
ncbi:MAG: hypothetical protein IPG12_00890 [Saprospiraceae bacterium]|nr:hypothetical protein [Saprospiraceae bacterium]